MCGKDSCRILYFLWKKSLQLNGVVHRCQDGKPFWDTVFSVTHFFRSHTNGKMSAPPKCGNYLPQGKLLAFFGQKGFLPSSILSENKKDTIVCDEKSFLEQPHTTYIE